MSENLPIFISLEPSGDDEPEDMRTQAEITRERDVTAIVDGYYPDLETVTQSTREDQRSVADAKTNYNIGRHRVVQEAVKLGDDLETISVKVSWARTITTELSENGQSDPRDAYGWLKEVQSVEQVQAYLDFIREWKARFVLGHEGRKAIPGAARMLVSILRNLAGIGMSEGYRRTPDFIHEYAAAIYDEFDFIYSLPEDYDSEIITEFQYAAMQGALATGNIENCRNVTQLFRELQNADNQDALLALAKQLRHYAAKYPITPSSVIGMRDKLYPALSARDPQVEVLHRATNSWSTSNNTSGIADVVMHSYAVDVDPASVNQLAMMAREIPTSDINRFELNRRDALALRPVFGAMRDFIHDQRPLVHDVLVGMIQFYETGESEGLVALLDLTEGYFANGNKDRQALVLDRAKYDTEVEVNAETKQTEKVIDILRRLAENTRPVHQLPPQTSNRQLNEATRAVFEANDSVEQHHVAVAHALNAINDQLTTSMTQGEIGIEPNMVNVINWLERQGFLALQAVTYEEQMSLHHQRWFLEILRFQELTCSPDEYNPSEVEGYLIEVANAGSYQSANRIIAKRLASHLVRLQESYHQQGRTHMSNALWSGNINHELMGLVDLRPASTAVGQRHRRDSIEGRTGD